MTTRAVRPPPVPAPSHLEPSTIAQWFGPADRPLFGRLHRPTSTAVRALVIVSPSFGQEAVFGHYPLRAVSEELAALGFVVVRPDHDGTGDSAGSELDPDRLRAWLDGLHHAIRWGRQYTDAPLVLLGFRAGGLLATQAAAERDDVHGLVLWDVPRSGKQYLREQKVRHNVSVAPGGEGAVGPEGFTALGLSLTAEARASLSRIDLRRHDPLPADAVLVLERDGVPGLDPGAVARGGAVTRVTAHDQDALLSRQALPVGTHRAVLRWFESAYPIAVAPLHANVPDGRDEVVRDGIREAVTSVGPNGLFGVVTEPVDGASGPTVVFVPDSITPHTGLARIWTRLAREWAAAGVRSIRFDLAGCGDSPLRPGTVAHTVGQLAHIDDVRDAVRHASPADPSDTVLIGLCSGAYLALETALIERPRALALINPVLSFITPEARPDRRRRALVVSRGPLARWAGPPTRRLAERLSRTHRTPAFTTDPAFAWDRAVEACFWQVYFSDVAPWLPDRAWRVINALLTRRRTHRILRAVRRRGTQTLFLAGDPDWTRSTLGSLRPLRRLERAGGLRLRHVRGLDHAMMRPGDTDEVARELTAFVAAALPDTSVPGAASSDVPVAAS